MVGQKAEWFALSLNIINNTIQVSSMKILVTGGCGFIGSNFILNQLSQTENEILNLDKLTYAGNPENLASQTSNSRYHFVKGDICDRELVESLFHTYDIKGVIHFAAESHVDNSIKNHAVLLRQMSTVLLH